MTQTGSPLFLSIYNTDSGSTTAFLDWRLDLDGPSGSSNMMSIDSFSGSITGSLVTLSGRTIREARGFLDLDSIYVVSESTSPGIGETVEGKIIKFTPDVTNTSPPYIKISGEYQSYPIKKLEFDGSLSDIGSGRIVSGNAYFLKFENSYYIEISSVSNYHVYYNSSDGDIIQVSGSNPSSSGSNISRLERAHDGVFSGTMVTLDKDSGLGGSVVQLVAGSSISLETTTSTSSLILRIPDSSITSGKLGIDSVGEDQYVDGSILNEHFSASAITVGKRVSRTRDFLVDMEYSTLSFSPSGSGWIFPSGVKTTACGYFDTPRDCLSDLSITPILMADTSGSTFYTGLCGYYGQSGSQLEFHERLISTSGSITTGCSLLLPVTSGCLVRVTFSRDDTSILDTGGSSLYLLGVLVSYTADS